MSDAEDRIEEPFINSTMSSLEHHASTAQKRKMSHSDHLDDGTPPLHITNTSSNAADVKVAYNGPSSIYTVMLRVHNESSARPMPQAAFFGRDKALGFSLRVLLQWCDAHYDDYLWKGPESLRGGLVERYAAYHAQTGQQLAVADVIRVSIFDAKETEVVLKKEDMEKDESEVDEGNEEKLDEGHNAEHQEQVEEGSEENSEDTETTSTHSTQTQGPIFETTLADSAQAEEEEEIDLETLSALLAHNHQAAPGKYATGLATRLANRDEQDTVSGSRRRGAWREDHEMRVFGGSTEHDTY
ncbi:hypothetical protein KCU95_g6299, partial [Aureobasidium melanogenum]